MLRPYRAMIALGIGLLVLSAPCELFPAVVWKFVTDDIVLKQNDSPWMWRWFSFNGGIESRYVMLFSAVCWLFLVYLTGEALGTLDTWILNRVAQRFILSLRNRVYDKLQHQSLAYLQRQRTGDLMSRAMNDVDELQSFVVSGIDVIIGEGLMWIVTVAIVMAVDWRVATASLSPLVLVYVLLRIFNKRVRPIYAAARERLGDVGNRLQENLSGIVVIKIFGRERQERDRFESATRAYYDQQIRAINARQTYFPVSRAVGFLSNVLMIGVGGYYMLKDMSFTPGKLVMFRAYWWRLFGPIQTLARVNDMVQRAVAAARRVFEVLDAPDELPDAPDAASIESVTGALELRNVTFSYGGEASGMGSPPAARDPSPMRPPPQRLAHGRDAHATVGAPMVLHEVSIKIDPGTTVALVGPSGGGKSTILNLLLRFYDPTGGAVTIDGRDLRSIRRESLRRHMALVQQETFLFNDSILDNVRYGHTDATMEQVVAAAKAANAHAFITKMPNAYDTRVGERGVRLSGGQKQRISIARAFLANPQVLLLDEPTSSVEPESESAIIAALGRLMRGRTTVLTSHRPSLVGRADVVYVIEDGRVTDHGAPDDVRQRNAWFARFMSSPDGCVPADAEVAEES